MPTRNEIIRDSTLKARLSWEEYTGVQQNRIFDVFDDAANRLTRDIERFTVKGVVPPARLTQLHANIVQEMKRIRPQLKTEIMRGMRNSIDYGMKSGVYSMTAAIGAEKKIPKAVIGTGFIGKDGLVRKYDAAVELFSDSAWAKINTNAMDFLMRFEPTGITLSDRVWDITWNAEKALRNNISTDVLLGKGPASLSRTIRGYLSEPEKLFRRVRKNGKLILSKAAQAYHPGRGVYRSSYANALRLAQTEMSRAYSEGTQRYATEKKWIDGYIWRQTSGRPCDICASRDGQFYPKKGTPDLPAHPWCYCYLELHISKQSEKRLSRKTKK